MYEFQKQKTKYQLLAYVSSLWKSYVPSKVPMREELRLRKTKFSQSLALFFWKTNFRTCEQHLQFRAWRVTHLFFWIQENRNTKFVIKRENRDSNQGTHNLMPHCRTMRRWMYGSGSGGDDDGVPPSPPLGTVLADAASDMRQRPRRTRRKPSPPARWGAGGGGGVDVKGKNREGRNGNRLIHSHWGSLVRDMIFSCCPVPNSQLPAPRRAQSVTPIRRTLLLSSKF